MKQRKYVTPECLNRGSKIWIPAFAGMTMIMILSISPTWASQKSLIKEANEHFKKKQWDSAVDLYLNALEDKEHADLVQYNLGTAFYKQGNYDQAIEHLKKSSSSKNNKITSKSDYNLGNAYYKKGLNLEEKKLEEAIESMQQALTSYEKSLNNNPKDTDAQYNRKLVAKELERLQKNKQEKEKQEKQDPKDRKDQKNQKDQKENQPRDQKSANDEKDQEKDKQESSKKEEQKQDDKKEASSSSLKEQKAQQSETKQQDQLGVKEGQEKNLEEKKVQQMLVEYEREDAPKGILYFVDRQQGEKHVDKDW